MPAPTAATLHRRLCAHAAPYRRRMPAMFNDFFVSSHISWSSMEMLRQKTNEDERKTKGRSTFKSADSPSLLPPKHPRPASIGRAIAFPGRCHTLIATKSASSPDSVAISPRFSPRCAVWARFSAPFPPWRVSRGLVVMVLAMRGGRGGCRSCRRSTSRHAGRLR